MKLHPIADFQALFPEAFNTLIKEHMRDLEKYKYSSFVCPECDVINPVYYNSPHESYKPFKDSYGDIRQLHCENCGYEDIKPFKQCFTCSKDYKGNRFSQYCSRECAGLNHRTGENVECRVCKKEFYKTNSELKRTLNNYCSQACYITMRPKIKLGKIPSEFQIGDVLKSRNGHYRILQIYHLTPEKDGVSEPKLKMKLFNGQGEYWVRYKVSSNVRREVLRL